MSTPLPVDTAQYSTGEQPVNVLVLFGGISPEHPVSIVSAVGVLNAMDPQKFRPIPVGITSQGYWNRLGTAHQHGAPWSVATLVNDDSDETSAGQSALGSRLPQVPEPDQPVHLVAGDPVTLRNDDGEVLEHVDIVFPLLHGPGGEDGSLQGYCETVGVPYVGTGVLSSAVGMDKHFMKIAFVHAGLDVGDWVTITERQWQTEREAVLQRVGRLPLPVFVKPARGGSSLGISRVDAPEQLEPAIEQARTFDTKVLVEVGIDGREIECAVLDLGPDEGSVASYPGEISVVGDDEHLPFYDFSAKYQDQSAAQLQCPADLSDEAIREIRQLAVRGFDAVDARGLSRVDFFYTHDGHFVINEINTMPGFTPISMYPQMWEHSGVNYSSLIEHLITHGLNLGRRGH
ncbi:D-alanine--D-alanine ligase [Auritidibacter ignavus]|uniref:D-alanine--D-alanine ligase n=1 Tax=Auritidibacter ignavus TaxID=678932 RepID=A0AAJ6DCF9_9MICC|nr:D-alanine--D-alanine ligase family protein [Auritidibacter ignavus]WGH93434.1 D-alanine--D-alanine ligase [Auritidibacter ignavus]